MRAGRLFRTEIAAPLLLVLGATTVFGADASPADADVAAELKALKSRVAELEQKESASWLTAERAKEIRQVVDDALADARTRPVQSVGGIDAGYKNGFFIGTSDGNFNAKVNGYFQYRYTYSHSQAVNPSAFGSTAPRSGDENGFDFRYARITLSGNAFSKNITYLFTGDFAGDAPNVNNFQLVDGFIAYRFNDQVNLRAGAFITPYSYILYISSGLQLVDFPTIFNTFNPDRSTGLSVYGDIIKDKLQYEVNVNDGPRTNHVGRADDPSATGTSDNRLSFATRETYFGGTGKPSDFTDESDLRKDKSTLAWMVGAAFDYDSANVSSNAFPGKQGGSGVPGVGSNNSPGFVGSYPLNGDIYRATVDGNLKYNGFSATSAIFFQQINENPGAGITFPTGYNPITNKSSFYQFAPYLQAGYMLTPQWEVVGRVGSLWTEGSPNTMQEYTVGLNYFLFGKNFKIQTDLTYIPNEAPFNATTFGTVLNTQDLIFRAQLQLKF